MLFSLPGAAILDFVWNAAVYRPTVVGIEGEKVHRPKNSALHGCQPSPRTVKLHVAADVARTYVFVRWRAAPGCQMACCSRHTSQGIVPQGCRQVNTMIVYGLFVYGVHRWQPAS